jgi:predicted porin
MKKTLIALSVLVAAGSVNAATVYQNEGFSADVFGDLEVRYAQNVADEEARIKAADYDFGFSASSQVSDDVTIFGTASFNGDENANSTDSSVVTVDNGFIGFSAGEVTVTAGRVVNFVDEIGVANDQTIAGLLEADTNLADKTDQVFKTVYDAGNFYAGIAITEDSDGDNVDTDELSQVDVMAGVVVAGADIRVTYVDGKYMDGATQKDADLLAIEAHYSIEGWDLAALYTDSSNDKVDSDAIAVSAQYTMDKTTVGGGYSTRDTEGKTTADQAESQWYANVSYALATNASVYAEITDTDKKGDDMGYAVGAKLKF